MASNSRCSSATTTPEGSIIPSVYTTYRISAWAAAAEATRERIVVAAQDAPFRDCDRHSTAGGTRPTRTRHSTTETD